MATGITDQDYITAERIRAEALRTSQRARQTAATAFAIAQGVELVRAYRKQKRLADRGLKLSEEMHDRIRKVFHPRELEFLKEFGYDGGLEIENPDVVGRRYGGRLRAIVAKAYAEKEKQILCAAPRYCTSSTQKILQDLRQERAFALANASIMGRNIAFSEYRAQVDLARKRRLQAIGLGKGLASQAATMAEAAGRGLAGRIDSAARGLNKAMNDFVNAGIDYSRYDRADAVRRAGGTWEDVVNIERNLMGGEQSYMPSVYSANSGLQTASSLQAHSMSAFTNLQSAEQLMDNETRGASSSQRFHSRAADSGFNNFGSVQHDNWNHGELGNADTVRGGRKIYSATGSPWTGYYVTVDMNDFDLLAVDDKPADRGI